MNKSAQEGHRDVALQLSSNLARLLREFSRDYERRIADALTERGYVNIRPVHLAVFANLGLGAVRVTELADKAQVTQQAMGKMLKELERLGYVTRGVDRGDKRARDVRLTERGYVLLEESLSSVEQVRGYYASKMGRLHLEELEARLQEAVLKLELDYRPMPTKKPEGSQQD
ncbi:MAG: MarR family transcriptional regulator [Pseudomonadota bacterium]